MAFSEFNLSNLNGSNGFSFILNDHSGYSPTSVSGAGDVNNDGIDDLIIGAQEASQTAGQSYVVFGRSGQFSANVKPSNLNGSNGFAINGIKTYGYSGSSVSGAGDVNNDGIDDLITSSRSGQSYVVFGRSGGFSASLNLSNLNSSNGFVINGVAGDGSSYSVSGAGDINHDGIDDLLIGAPGDYLNGGLSGRSYVVFGRSGGFSASLDLSSLNGSNGFTISGSAGDYSGWSVSGTGDVNNDGIDDLLIGAPYAGPNDSGKSYVVFGRRSRFSASLNLSNLNGSNGFTINGIPPYDDYYRALGWSVSGAGDVNNDGIDDLMIATLYYPRRSYVVFGRSGGFSASLDLSSLNGSNGFTISGSAGGPVSGVGDVNGDGIDDLIVGTYTGQSVVFGRSSGFSASLDLSSLNGSNGFGIPGASSDASGAGDINNDGIDDLIVSNSAGQNYVVFGLIFPRGTSGNNLLIGTGNNDTLEGLAGNDTLSGELGDDLLDGGSGNDVLIGQQGNDTCVFDSMGDNFVESVNQGNDTIRVVFNYTLGSNIERLGLLGNSNLTGTGNNLNNLLSGNIANNLLQGLAGNDTLTGDQGNDTLVGGIGNDVYIIDVNGDVVQETSTAASGTDTVRSFVSYTLGANVERLGLQGQSNLSGNGNGFNNFIAGNQGDNRLNGQAGNDSLNGGVGNDTLYGGASNDLLIGDSGNDRFLYSTGAAFESGAIGVDRLTDFSRLSDVDTDKIVLSQTTFGAGTNFASVGTDSLAATSAAHITFSTATGHLFYNQNGSAVGLGTGGHFATLSDINSASITGTNTLLATDFLVIA
jgi:Ca2+-binding RTX toxin-like protein